MALVLSASLVFVLFAGLLGAWAFPDWRQRWQSACLLGWVRAHPWLVRRGSWLMWSVVALCLPCVVVWFISISTPRTLEGFDDQVMPANEHVAWLLQGEQLIPPQPLPPEVFETAEAEMTHPMLASADRRWEQMSPEFVQRLLQVFKIMKEAHGYDMALLEGWRSPERQALLAAKGAHVTQAGPGRSYHQHGFAADAAFYRDGQLVISEKDPWAMRGYELYGQVAERLGLTWGGRWKMMDLGHVEWRSPEARVKVQAGR